MEKQDYKNKLKLIEVKLNALKEEGYLYTANGIEKVNWGKYNDSCGLNSNPEDVIVNDEAREKCQEVDRLIYARNFLKSKIFSY